MHTVYLGLGSNLGDRAANLAAAIAALPPNVRVAAQSSIYETAPWGYADQPAFLNQVFATRTAFRPRGLLAFLKNIERRVGRTPSFRNGPREIDIDILFYDDLQLDEPGLTIPHPRLHERAFVLVPLTEIAPDLIHPAAHKTIQTLLGTIDTAGVHAYQQQAGADA
ncbi:MAG: 2-amino-4-hydroxy-6-hydroxymethyldihydropteridine diphosphokinase [Chloroflexi bacterium]|nr:2-amino-4-hydroxy-6-hydroxymethyldihydropteridine diphosphokinase [Chloroflexota bacterium]